MRSWRPDAAAGSPVRTAEDGQVAAEAVLRYLSDSEFRPLVATPLQRSRRSIYKKIAYARLCFTRQCTYVFTWSAKYGRRQCWGSGSVSGSASFWASRIRIH